MSHHRTRANPFPYAAEWAASWSVTLAIVFAVVLLIGTGCSVADTYVASDRKVYNQIAPRYSAYTEADTGLSRPEKDRRLRTVVAWDVRISSQEDQE